MCPIQFLMTETFDIIANGIRATSTDHYVLKCGSKKLIGTQRIRDNLAVLDYIHFFFNFELHKVRLGALDCHKLGHYFSDVILVSIFWI